MFIWNFDTFKLKKPCFYTIWFGYTNVFKIVCLTWISFNCFWFDCGSSPTLILYFASFVLVILVRLIFFSFYVTSNTFVDVDSEISFG